MQQTRQLQQGLDVEAVLGLLRKKWGAETFKRDKIHMLLDLGFGLVVLG